MPIFIKMSPNRKKIILNVFWSILGKIVTMLGILFVGILVARYLGPSQYGLMSYVISFVSLFSIIANFGLDGITIRELAKDQKRTNNILGTVFRLRLFFSMIAFFLCILFAFISNADATTIILIGIYALYLFTSPFSVIRNYFTAIIKNEYVVKSEITRTIIGALIKIIMLWFKAPLIFFIVATAFDFYLVAGGYLFSYKRHVGSLHDWKYDAKLGSFFCKESFPLAFSAAAIIVYQKIDQIMIKHMIDDSSVGYFATAASFLGIVYFLPDVITQTVAPLLIKVKVYDEKKYEERAQQFVNITLWISIIIAFFLFAFAYYLIALTYGSSYLVAVPILEVLAWKTVGSALSAASGQIMIIQNIQKWAFLRNIVGTFLCIILNMFFIPRWGALGSAYVAVITIFVSGFLVHALIPSCRYIFKMQIKAFVFGWMDLLYIRRRL